MIIAIPLSSDSAQSVIVQLGSSKYQFDVRWNDRSGTWCMDLLDDATQAVILQGIPMVLGCDVLLPYKLGIGSMITIDESGTGMDAGFDDLGSRVNLYWISPDEVPI